ncbi:MAG TPA: hypothetical protein VHY32_03355, partial [Caulobacteraceae bacterium]|nr:hypothetical protein [Caulobacteraceae bacterium]
MSSPELGAHEGDRAAPADDGDSYATVRRRMDHLLDLLRGSIESRSFAPPAPWLTLDLSETEQAYTVVAELPGIE